MDFVEETSQSLQFLELQALYYEDAGFKAFSMESHLFFIIPFFLCVIYKRRFAAVLVALAAIISLNYHTCLAYLICGGITQYKTRLSDHLTANLLIVAAISLVTGSRDDPQSKPTHWRLEFAHISLPVQLVSVALAIISEPFSIYDGYVSLVIALWSLGAYPVFFRNPITRRLEDGSYIMEPLAVSWYWAVLSVASLGGAFACFIIGGPLQTITLPVAPYLTVTYAASWVHSLWHILASFGISFLVLAVSVKPTSPVTRFQYEKLSSLVQRRLHASGPLRITIH